MSMKGDDPFWDLFDELFYKRTDEKIIVAKLLAEILKDKNLNLALDIGAGPGDITEVLAKYTKKLSIVEANSRYESKLRGRFPTSELFVSDFRKVKLSSKYDFILLNQLLYFIPSSEWVSECQKLIGHLNENGELVVILNDHDSGDLKLIFNRFYDRVRANLSWHYLSLDKFISGLRDTNKCVVTTIPYSYKLTYNSLEETTTAIQAIIIGLFDDKTNLAMRNEVTELSKTFQVVDGSYQIFLDAKIIVIKPPNNPQTQI